MTDQPRDARFKVSADRSSASRKIRYVETNQGDADDCTLCQLDEHGTLVDETIVEAVAELPDSAAADAGVDEDEEALDLMKFQNAYNLASKCISVFSEIYDRLILNTGV